MKAALLFLLVVIGTAQGSSTGVRGSGLNVNSFKTVKTFDGTPATSVASMSDNVQLVAPKAADPLKSELPGTNVAVVDATALTAFAKTIVTEEDDKPKKPQYVDIPVTAAAGTLGGHAGTATVSGQAVQSSASGTGATSSSQGTTSGMPTATESAGDSSKHAEMSESLDIPRSERAVYNEVPVVASRGALSAFNSKFGADMGETKMSTTQAKDQPEMHERNPGDKEAAGKYDDAVEGPFKLIDRVDTYFTVDPVDPNSDAAKLCIESMSGEAVADKFDGTIFVSTEGTIDKTIPIDNLGASCYKDPDETGIFGKFVDFVVSGSGSRVEISTIGEIRAKIHDIGFNNKPLDITGKFDLTKWIEAVDVQNEEARQKGGQFNHLVSGWFVVEQPHAMVARFDYQTTDEKFDNVAYGKSQTAAMNNKGVYLGEIRIFFENRDSISARKQIWVAQQAQLNAKIALNNALSARRTANEIRSRVNQKKTIERIRQLRDEQAKKQEELALKLSIPITKLRNGFIPPPMVSYPPPPGNLPAGELEGLPKDIKTVTPDPFAPTMEE